MELVAVAGGYTSIRCLVCFHVSKSPCLCYEDLIDSFLNHPGSAQ